MIYFLFLNKFSFVVMTGAHENETKESKENKNSIPSRLYSTAKGLTNRLSGKANNLKSNLLVAIEAVKNRIYTKKEEVTKVQEEVTETKKNKKNKKIL